MKWFIKVYNYFILLYLLFLKFKLELHSNTIWNKAVDWHFQFYSKWRTILLVVRSQEQCLLNTVSLLSVDEKESAWRAHLLRETQQAWWNGPDCTHAYFRLVRERACPISLWCHPWGAGLVGRCLCSPGWLFIVLWQVITAHFQIQRAVICY